MIPWKYLSTFNINRTSTSLNNKGFYLFPYCCYVIYTNEGRMLMRHLNLLATRNPLTLFCFSYFYYSRYSLFKYIYLLTAFWLYFYLFHRTNNLSLIYCDLLFLCCCWWFATEMLSICNVIIGLMKFIWLICIV